MNLDNKNESVAVSVICTYTYILLDSSVYGQNMARMCLCIKIMFVSPLQFPRTLLLPSRHCEACSLHSNFLETVSVCVCVCVCVYWCVL